jgi:hypothetical protein
MTMQDDDFEGVGFGQIDGDVVLLTERGAAVVVNPAQWPRRAEHQSRIVLRALYEMSGGQPGVAVDVDALVMSGNVGGPGITRQALNRLVDMGFAQKAAMDQAG